MEKRKIVKSQIGQKWQEFRDIGNYSFIFLTTFAKIALWNGKGTLVCNRRGDACKVSLTGWVERNWWHYLDDEMYLTLSERKVAGDITTLVESRPCNILLLDQRQFFVTEEKRGKVSNIWQVRQTTQLSLLPESSRDGDFRQIFQQDYPPILRPTVIAWSHDNLIMGNSLTTWMTQVIKRSQMNSWTMYRPFSGSKYDQFVSAKISCRSKSISVLISYDIENHYLYFIFKASQYKWKMRLQKKSNRNQIWEKCQRCDRHVAGCKDYLESAP